MIELLGEEQKIVMTPKQMTEILNLVNKEEIIEMEEKVEKALGQVKTATQQKVADGPLVNNSTSNGKLVGEQLSIEQVPFVNEVEKTKEESQKSSTAIEEQQKKKASGNQSTSL